MENLKTYLIGLDIGTSSVKGVLVSSDGKEHFTARSEFKYTYRGDGTVEISTEKYIKACYSLFKDLMQNLPAGSNLAGICATSASGNILFLDENNKPTTPIINWQDTRTTNETDLVLGENFDTDAYFRSTGWAFDKKTFPLATLCRYKYHHPEVIENSSMLCMSTEYLYYLLTGEWGIGTSAATPFYLVDQRSGKYNTAVLETLGLSEKKLPPVKRTGSILGYVTEEASRETSLPVGTPIILGTFDHPSAARGVGIRREGQLLLSCGTSWVGFYPINDRDKAVSAKMLIDPFLSEQNGPWAGMISIPSVSARIEKYTRRYIADDNNIYNTLTELSAKSENGAGGLIIDLTQEPDDKIILKYPKHHIARAIMEGVVKLLAAEIDRLASFGIIVKEAVMVGGPSERPLWSEIIAEKTGMTVRVMHGAFAGAIGAAIVAGVGCSIFESEEEAYDVFAGVI
ncbi:MAG: hypothetical protein E7672_06950 [Ruminococcaceae bacterium]|nr:hypothetical protein [Oscillospiraceae bacterium]